MAAYVAGNFGHQEYSGHSTYSQRGTQEELVHLSVGGRDDLQTLSCL